jgi:hypothetical protein
MIEPIVANDPKAVQKSVAVPPYLSYKTFNTFIEGLKVGIPTRIDRTVLSSMSGAVQAQLMAALRYLGLVTQHSVTQEKLAQLVNSEGPERQRVLTELFRGAYPFIFEGFDLQRATTGEIEEAFRKVGASGETIRKCVAFFLAGAKAAGIPVSPHIKTSRVSRTASPRLKKAIAINANGSDPRVPDEDPVVPQQPSTTSWSQMLLAKFPSFDPAWPDEVKTKWFESFDRLMKSDGKV